MGASNSQWLHQMDVLDQELVELRIKEKNIYMLLRGNFLLVCVFAISTDLTI